VQPFLKSRLFTTNGYKLADGIIRKEFQLTSDANLAGPLR